MATAEKSEILNVEIKKLYDTICDLASYPKFVTGVKKTTNIGGNDWHFEVDLMKAVDYDLSFQQSFDESSGTAKVSWVLKNSSFFKKNSGAWTLKTIAPGKTQATYSLELDFSFPVPGFILKGMISNALPKNIQDFYQEAKKRG